MKTFVSPLKRGVWKNVWTVLRFETWNIFGLEIGRLEIELESFEGAFEIGLKLF